MEISGLDRDGATRSVVIVGGGTAGWLTAGLLAADYCAADADGLSVTVVESPTVPTLGVGEGTWPSLRDTLRRIGLSENEFLRRCHGSFKQGSRFDGWVDGSDTDRYFHPFSAPPDPDEIDALALWQAAGPAAPFAAAVSPQIPVCLKDRGPKQPGTPEFAGVTNYAYHLDAFAFAEMLREHCTERLGVTHIKDDMIGPVLGADGFVTAVETGASGMVTGDLFIDCTGSRALIIGEAMESPLTDVSGILFNDRALAVHVPYTEERAAIASQTNATAAPFGWIWDIGLSERRGVGHVFSSAHGSEDAVLQSLTGYLERTSPGLDVSTLNPRMITFRSAYRRAPWVKNVVGIGMAAGFVEPLEASAIVMAELAATMVSDCLPPDKAHMAAVAARFNDRFSYRWDRIVDFLKLHYVLSRRKERYWRDHRDEATWPDRLVGLLQEWRQRPPSREDFGQAREIFPAASYLYVLYGMGFETEPPRLRHRSYRSGAITAFHQRRETMAQRYLAGLPPNRDLLDHVRQRGFPAA